MIVRFTDKEIEAINALEAEYERRKAAIDAEIERLAPADAPDTDTFFAGLDPEKDPEAWTIAIAKENDAISAWVNTGSDEWKAARKKSSDLLNWIITERNKLYTAAADRQFAELNGDVIAIVDDFRKQVGLVLQSIYDSENEQQQRLAASGGGYRSSVYSVAMGGSEWKLNPDELRKAIKNALHWHYDALKDAQSIIDSFDRFLDETLAASDLVAKPGEGEPFGKIEAPTYQPKYRTKAMADASGAITEVPSSIAIPTLHQYEYATSLYNQGNAYVQPFVSTAGLRFNEGKLYFEGRLQPLTEMEIQNLITKEKLYDVNTGYLRTFYSLILGDFQTSGYQSVRDVITINVSALAMTLGKDYNLSERTALEIKKIIEYYHDMVGVLHTEKDGKKRTSYYQVLTFQYYDAEHNVIAFSSPYMNKVIQTIYNVSIRRDKKGEPRLKASGEPLLLPSHSYLIKPSLQKQRNDAAADNVQIIVTLIEQAGDNVPRIKASTIIERNPQLAERLEKSRNKSQLLQRVFKNTWQLLRDHTTLAETYIDIELPDPENPAYIPTARNLKTLVISFPHKGKRKPK